MRERVNLKSPVRENRPPGSVRGAAGNRRPYRDMVFLVFGFLHLIAKASGLSPWRLQPLSALILAPEADYLRLQSILEVDNSLTAPHALYPNVLDTWDIRRLIDF